MKPSEDNGTFWHFAWAPYSRFRSSYITGKWMIYVPDNELDEVWSRVKDAVEQEGIAPGAKCSTALVNPRQESHGSKIICVYVDHYKAEEETKEVLTHLRRIGIKGKLKFKRDKETFESVYGKDSFWMYSRKGTDVVRYKWNQDAV